MAEVFRGRKDLAVTTSDSPRGATATPTREAPPIEEAAIKEAQELLRQGVRRDSEIILDQPRKRRLSLRTKAGLTLGALAALGLSAWGISRLYSDDDNSPTTQSQSIDKPNSFNPEGMFDDDAEKGILTKDNRSYVSQEEIDKLPTEDENGDPLYLLPLILDGDEDIEYEYDDENFPVRVRLHRVEEKFEIVAAHDGYAFAARPLVKRTDGKYHPASSGKAYVIRVVFKGPDGNAHMIDVSTGANKSQPDNLLSTLDGIPSIGQDNSNGKDIIKGFQVKRGTVLGSGENFNVLLVHSSVKKLQGGHVDPNSENPEENRELLQGKRLNFITIEKIGSPKIAVKEPTKEEQASTLEK